MIRVIHDDKSMVSSKPSEVIMQGPDDIDVSMTPRAAVETAGELLEKAAEAVGKQAVSDDQSKRMAAQGARSGHEGGTV